MIFNILYILYLFFTLPYHLIRIIKDPKRKKGLKEKLGIKLPPFLQNCIWVHAVSVGETLAARKLVELLKKRYSSLSILFTVSTYTGMEVAEKYINADVLWYFPFDLTIIVRKFLKRVNPKIIVLMESEIWPNLIILASRKNIPIVVVNGRFTEKAIKNYMKAKPLFHPVFQKIKLFCVQNQEYYYRLIRLGIEKEKIMITGNQKYDNIEVVRDLKKDDFIEKIKKCINYDPQYFYFIAGSTHYPEESIIIKSISNLSTSFRSKLITIIVPRHPERSNEIAKEAEKHNFKPILWSKINQKKLFLNSDNILIIDTVGILHKIYSIANLVFVGGSLISHGGQNIIEPISLGKYVICGPSMYNFIEPFELFYKEKFISVVKNSQEITLILEKFIKNPPVLDKQKVFSLLSSLKGASQRNVEIIQQFISSD